MTLPRSVRGKYPPRLDSWSSLSKPLWRRLDRNVCRSTEGGAIAVTQAWFVGQVFQPSNRARRCSELHQERRQRRILALQVGIDLLLYKTKHKGNCSRIQGK